MRKDLRVDVAKANQEEVDGPIALQKVGNHLVACPVGADPRDERGSPGRINRRGGGEEDERVVREILFERDALALQVRDPLTADRAEELDEVGVAGRRVQPRWQGGL